MARTVFKKTTIKQLVNLADPKRKVKRVPEYRFPGITIYSRRGQQ